MGEALAGRLPRQLLDGKPVGFQGNCSLRGGPAHPHRPRENFSLLWVSSLVEGLNTKAPACPGFRVQILCSSHQFPHRHTGSESG